MVSSIILIVLSIPIIPQIFWIAMVLFFALWKSKANLIQSNNRSKFKILVPAHNEELVITQCIQSIKLLEYPSDLFSVTIIADNCTDKTAEIAKSLNVDVWERTSISRKSKGYALEDAFNKFMREEDFTAFVVIDADTLVSKSLLGFFDEDIRSGKDWIQAYYSGSNVNTGWRTQLMEWGFAIFNGVYMRGLSGMDISVPLRGNGMCFTTSGLKRSPWRCSGLAEDMEFSWELRLKGERVYFNQKAHVLGEFVSANSAAKSQRQRWEEGRDNVRKQYINRINEFPLKKQFLYLLDLKMWSLGKITGYLILLSLLSLIMKGLTPNFLLIMWFIIFIYGMSPVLFGFCSIKLLASAIHIPRYIIWKAVLKFKKGPATWVRTKREGEGP